MAKSDRANSIAGQVKAAQNASKWHEWPSEAGGYDDESLAIYLKNQCFRAFEDWNDADLFELARVAKLQAMAVYEMELLESEGFIVMGGKNGDSPIENPRNRAISTANSTIGQMLRRLGITASNSGGDRQTKAKRGQQERNASTVINGNEDEQATYSGQSLM